MLYDNGSFAPREMRPAPPQLPANRYPGAPPQNPMLTQLLAQRQRGFGGGNTTPGYVGMPSGTTQPQYPFPGYGQPAPGQIPGMQPAPQQGPQQMTPGIVPWWDMQRRRPTRRSVNGVRGAVTPKKKPPGMQRQPGYAPNELYGQNPNLPQPMVLR